MNSEVVTHFQVSFSAEQLEALLLLYVCRQHNVTAEGRSLALADDQSRIASPDELKLLCRNGGEIYAFDSLAYWLSKQDDPRDEFFIWGELTAGQVCEALRLSFAETFRRDPGSLKLTFNRADVETEICGKLLIYRLSWIEFVVTLDAA